MIMNAVIKTVVKNTDNDNNNNNSNKKINQGKVNASEN